MTKRQFLASADSTEISQWFAYFKVKSEREKDARESAAFERRVESGFR
jgi:hypothetical protein